MVETPAAKPTVDTLDEKLNGMQEAVRLLQASVDRMPTPDIVQSDVDALKELTAANFKAARELMDAKFDGNKTALDAALKTQKEASDKIESASKEQNVNVLATISALRQTTDDKISDLKDRFNTREGQTTGTGSANAASRALLFSIIGMVIAAVVGAGGLIFGIAAMLRAGGAG